MAETMKQKAERWIASNKDMVSNSMYALMKAIAECPHLNPEMYIDALDKWAAEHLPMTYKDDFFEKFPNALRTYSHGEPFPTLASVHLVCTARQDEYSRIPDHEAWDKPLGYWEGNS